MKLGDTKRLLIGGVVGVRVRMGHYLIQDGGRADCDKVTAFILIEEITVHVELQSNVCNFCKYTERSANLGCLAVYVKE